MNTAKAETFKILDQIKPGAKISARNLTLIVNARIGESHFPDTYLRYLRAYRAATGKKIVNIDKKKSTYQLITEE